MTVEQLPGQVDLREVRVRLGLSAVEVGQAVAVHPTTVLRWERRDRLPGPGHLRGLARTYGLPVAAVSAFFDEARTPAGAKDGLPGPGLRRLRRLHHYSAARLAAEVRVPAHTVYNWEAGRSRVPEALLGDLAHAFSLQPGALQRLLQRWAHQPLPPAEPASPVRRLRLRSGLTQADLARVAGVGVTSLKAWERGHRPSLAGVRGLARALDLPTVAVARAVGLDLPHELSPAGWAPGDLPRVLRVLRQWSRLTQGGLADRCGVSLSAVRAWEQGRLRPGPRSRARLERLYRLGDGALAVCYPAAPVADRGIGATADVSP